MLKKTFYVLTPVFFVLLFGYEVLESKFTIPVFIDEPTQENLKTSRDIIIEGTNGPVDLELIADYEIEAVVKSTADYPNSSDDITTDVSPRDLALAWGDINNQLIDRYVTYSQHDRWYFFSLNSKAPVDIHYVDYYSANNHIIPADKTVKKSLMEIETGDFVSLKGYLVNVYFDNGYWLTSTRRDDTGDGSCEILYVTSIDVYGSIAESE